MLETIKAIGQVASCVTGIVAVAFLFIKPLRERVLDVKSIQEGQKCLLRADMLRTYYRHHEQKCIRQYEYENFIFEYKAYKALRGNSFIDKIYKEVQTWEVLT